MSKNPQPARKSYFFGKGYKDLENTIKGAWGRNFYAINHYKNNIRLAFGGGSGFIEIALKFLLNAMGMLSILVFGSIITFVITLLNIIILLVFMGFIYVGFTFIFIIDKTYLLWKKISSVCPECKDKMLIPTYKCPKCEEKHTDLTPGAYGILKRTCVCGEKLSTTFFGTVNGKHRRDYDAICPHCGYALADRETVPICIPVVGGRSVGKTAFITAFSRDFIEKIVPTKGWEIDLYNPAKQDIYKDIMHDYLTGNTRMTHRSQDINSVSSISFSFFIKGSEFKPERLVHIYDIAGEVFTDNIENEMQKQYEYCHGIVLLIDPFSIPNVRYRCEGKLKPEDIAGIGVADINGIVDSFLNKLREVTGLADRKMSLVPLAVVINKIDSAGLFTELGQGAVKALMATNPAKYNNEQDVQDYLCRKFLKENMMDAFLNVVNIKFKNNRFFACSSIGHTRGTGAYQPRAIMQPMEWLFRHADSKIAKTWMDTAFTNKPFASTMKVEDL